MSAGETRASARNSSRLMSMWAALTPLAGAPGQPRCQSGQPAVGWRYELQSSDVYSSMIVGRSADDPWRGIPPSLAAIGSAAVAAANNVSTARRYDMSVAGTPVRAYAQLREPARCAALRALAAPRSRAVAAVTSISVPGRGPTTTAPNGVIGGSGGSSDSATIGAVAAQ